MDFFLSEKEGKRTYILQSINAEKLTYISALTPTPNNVLLKSAPNLTLITVQQGKCKLSHNCAIIHIK